MFYKSLPIDLSSYTLNFWQIAQNGIWEDAVKIIPNGAYTTPPTLVQRIENMAQDIAIEAFFKDTDNNFYFLGIRIETFPKDTQKIIIQTLLNNTEPHSTLDDIALRIQKALTMDDFLSNTPDLLEIGAEGFWKSYGSYVVWNTDSALASITDIEQHAPQLLKPFKRPMMLELAWKKPTPYWLGIPISSKNADGLYQLSPEKYQKLSLIVTE